MKSHRSEKLTQTERRALSMLRRRPKLLACLVTARPGDCLVIPQTRATSQPTHRIR